MDEHEKLERFERCIMPHMDAAYNLARWLANQDQDAQDIVQDAFLRAFKFFAGFRGGDARAWLLRIVRNSFYDWLRHHRRAETQTPFDEQAGDGADDAPAPDTALIDKADREMLGQALEALPAEFREALVLRELEGLSYKEIADVAEVPLGTVMSRLARARDLLRKDLAERLRRETK